MQHVPRINGNFPSFDEATSDHQRLLERYISFVLFVSMISVIILVPCPFFPRVEITFNSAACLYLEVGFCNAFCVRLKIEDDFS